MDGIGQGNPDEGLRNVLHVDRQPHVAFFGEIDRFSGGGQGYALNVVGGTPHLVRSGNVGRAYADNGHPVVFFKLGA